MEANKKKKRRRRKRKRRRRKRRKKKILHLKRKIIEWRMRKKMYQLRYSLLGVEIKYENLIGTCFSSCNPYDNDNKHK